MNVNGVNSTTSSTSTSSSSSTGSSTSSTSTTATTSTDTGSASAAAIGYDTFLTLLTAQLRNQDPTSPTDSSQFLAQLASFSNVEQGIRTNTKLDSLITSLALSQAEGVIGHTITSSDGATSGEVASVRIITGGAVAVLTDGKEIPLEAGIRVS